MVKHEPSSLNLLNKKKDLNDCRVLFHWSTRVNGRGRGRESEWFVWVAETVKTLRVATLDQGEGGSKCQQQQQSRKELVQ